MAHAYAPYEYMRLMNIFGNWRDVGIRNILMTDVLRRIQLFY